MPSKYYESPVGTLCDFPWINKPDTKFNADGLYHTGMSLGGAEADKLKAFIDAAVDEAFEEHTGSMSPKDKKAWSKLYPYEVDTDDNDNPTGYIKFDFKQNAKIKYKKSGETVDISISLFDSEGEPMVGAPPIFNGTKARVRYSPRVVVVASTKKVGIRLDFAALQIAELAVSSGGAGRSGFSGAIEGSFKSSGSASSLPATAGEPPSADTEY